MLVILWIPMIKSEMLMSFFFMNFCYTNRDATVFLVDFSTTTRDENVLLMDCCNKTRDTTVLIEKKACKMLPNIN